MRKVITTLTFFWILFTQYKYCKFIQKSQISQKSFKKSYCELLITIALPVENTYVEWFHRPTQKNMSSPKLPRAFSAIIPINLSTAGSLETAYLELVAMHTMGCHVSSPQINIFIKQDLILMVVGERSVSEWSHLTLSCDAGKYSSQLWKPNIELNYSRK